MSRTRLPLLALAAYLILAVVMTYPLCLHLSSSLPGDIGDPLLNAWIMAWDGHALLTRPAGLFNANIFFPNPNTLAYSEHLLSTALLLLPAQLLTGEPLAAYNLAFLASFALSGWATFFTSSPITCGVRRSAVQHKKNTGNNSPPIKISFGRSKRTGTDWISSISAIIRIVCIGAFSLMHNLSSATWISFYRRAFAGVLPIFNNTISAPTRKSMH